jgi:hypothetical protein
VPERRPVSSRRQGAQAASRSGEPVIESSLPPAGARILAFLSILVAGLCGGLIGYAVADLQCTEGCGGTRAGVGAVVGAVAAAGGVAVVAVLVLRAMAEWRTLREDE